MQPTATVTPEHPDLALPDQLPDHMQLPDKDGSITINFQENPQSNLLTGSLIPHLSKLYPDGQYCIGHDCGIYYRHTQPPLDGCKAPDWFFVPGVPPMLNGQFRRSYVLWQEVVRPLLIIEYVSGDGRDERDTTPYRGKFWVYEQGIGAPYYAIFDGPRDSVELLELKAGRYRQVVPNDAGRLPIPPLGVELGIWYGTYRGMDLPWLRFWDAATRFLLSSEDEQAAAERHRAEAERHRAEAEHRRAETAESLLDDTRKRLEQESEARKANGSCAAHLAERLRSMGIDPDMPAP